MIRKTVYDLNILKREFGYTKNLNEEDFFFWWATDIIAKKKSFSFSSRCLDGRSYDNKGVEFYDKKHNYLGTETNSIGPYGTSDFWDYDEDGNVVSVDTPYTDISIFIDGCYDVAVVYK